MAEAGQEVTVPTDDYSLVCEIHTDRWLKERRTGIGASESPALFGETRYQSPMSLFAVKCGVEQQSEPTEAMLWGRRLEPLIIEAYLEEQDRQVLRVDAHTTRNIFTLRSKKTPCMIATPDAFLTREDRDTMGTLQCKKSAIGWDEEVPRYTYIQMQHEFYVTGALWGTALALVAGVRLVWKDVARDDEFIEKELVPLCKEFWRYVESGERLPEHFIDGTSHTTKALAALYPEAEGEQRIMLDDSFTQMSEDLKAQKYAYNELKNSIKEMGNIVRVAMGKHTIAELPNGDIFTLKTINKGAYPVKATTYRDLRFREGRKK